MTSGNGKSVRQWQEITEEASHVTDPRRLCELAEELDRALEERDKNIHLQRHSNERATGT